jgi:hypothetical protein
MLIAMSDRDSDRDRDEQCRLRSMILVHIFGRFILAR